MEREEGNRKRQKVVFEPVFGVELRVEDKFLSLGGIKEDGARMEEFERQKRGLVEVFVKGFKTTLYDHRSLVESNYPYIFAKSLVLFKRGDQSAKTAFEEKHEREINFYRCSFASRSRCRERGRFLLLRNVRECASISCSFNRTLFPKRRSTFEETIVELGEAQKSLTMTAIGFSSYLISLLVAHTRLVQSGTRAIALHLVDPNISELQLRYEKMSSSAPLRILPCVKLPQEFFSSDPHQPFVSAHQEDSSNEDLDSLVKFCLLNDGLYQLLEWFGTFPGLEFKATLYSSLSKYLEECEAQSIAKSDLLVCCDWREPSLEGSLPKLLRQNGKAITLMAGERAELRVLDSSANLVKSFDFEKQTWFVYNQAPAAGQEPQPFRPPEWARKVGRTVVIGVFDGPTFVEKIKLEPRLFYLFGRNADICDVPLEHAHASRQHAALIFDEAENMFVIDLDSKAGTTVDGKRLRAKEFVPIKEGSRLEFAQSGAHYVVTTEKD